MRTTFAGEPSLILLAKLHSISTRPHFIFPQLSLDSSKLLCIPYQILQPTKNFLLNKSFYTRLHYSHQFRRKLSMWFRDLMVVVWFYSKIVKSNDLWRRGIILLFVKGLQVKLITKIFKYITYRNQQRHLSVSTYLHFLTW